MGTRNIFIIGNYGAGNLGDDAILGGVLSELKEIGYSGGITVTHGGVRTSPEIYRGVHKVPFFPSGLRSRFRSCSGESLEALKRADLVIFGGGGLFTDEETWKAPIIWATQARACRKLNKSYVIYGQSIGPLRGFLAAYFTRKVFKQAVAIHVRDRLSLEELRRWNVKAVLGTDPAFSLLLGGKERYKRNIPRKPVLLISFRKWPGFSSQGLQPLIQEINVFCKRKKLKPILISMDVNEKLELGCWEFFQPRSALLAFEAFEKAQIAITMRLHAGIFALAAGTPLIALSYSQKVKGLFDDKCTVLSGNKLNAQTLREALKTLLGEAKFQAKSFNLEADLLTNRTFLTEALQVRALCKRASSH